MSKTLIKNFFFAFGAQVVSLLASLVVTFIAPTLIGVKEFGYWQLFLTYVTYVNISRLGLIDGLYLRLGGKNYSELDFDLLSMEHRIFVYFQIFISSIIFVSVLLMDIEGDRTFVLLSCCICMVIVNTNNYLSYVLQAVNLTSKYSVSVILQNVTWFIAVLLIYITRQYDFRVLIILYILGHVAAGIYLAFNAVEIIRFKKTKISRVIIDIKENIRCGIKLMVALYAGNLIIGAARMIIDASWGIEVFGYFSFSLTLANVFLTFVNRVSIVVFPAIRRIRKEKMQEAYYLLRNVLSFILPIVMLGYLPITLIVHVFLPNYVPSLKYLPIFLPICTFDGKMQMLCSSFFKALRKENTLLIINLITLVSSVLMAIIGAFFVKNIFFIAYGLLTIIMLRSIISEVVLSNMMKTSIKKELFQEIVLVFAFLVLAHNYDAYIMFVLYLIVYIGYVLLNKKRITRILELRNGFTKT